MNAHKLTVSVIAFAFAAAGAFTLSSSGCSSTPNAVPDASTHDSGRDGGGGTSGSGGSSGSGGTAGSPGDGGKDTGLPDTGSCKSDSSACNSCYTDAQAGSDPYNACSPYTSKCVQFTTTVPSHPKL